MNFIAIIILAAMLLDTGLSFIADILNLNHMRTVLPKAFEGLYDPERYAKAQRYLRVQTRFRWVTSFFDLVVVLLFWFGGGFALLDQWVRSLQWSAVPSGLIYIGILLAIKLILGLPFGLYATFGIEARFGFNTTTWRTYFLDRIKGLVLGIVLGGPLLAAVLTFFEYTGTNAWWYCWLAMVGFMLLVQYIVPRWIMPWFNRFDPLPPGELRDAITSYAGSIDFALDNIFVMDGSKRSTKSNAFFTGFGRHRRIVLFDTLIEKNGVGELVAVLAHEMGHFKQKHILKMLVIGILQSGLMFYILSLFISYPMLFEAFYVQQVSVYAGLIFFGLMYAPIDVIMGLAIHRISRHHEFAADHFAVTTAPQGKSLVEALKRLSVDNLSNLQPHPFYVFLHYSHPPVLQRIEAIEKMGKPEDSRSIVAGGSQ